MGYRTKEPVSCSTGKRHLRPRPTPQSAINHYSIEETAWATDMILDPGDDTACAKYVTACGHGAGPDAEHQCSVRLWKVW
jgi:hypothetical protein